MTKRLHNLWIMAACLAGFIAVAAVSQCCGQVQFQATQIGKSVTLQTPTSDGTAGQVIVTDGAKTLSFANVGSGDQEWTEAAGVLSPTTTTDRVLIEAGEDEIPLTIIGEAGQTADLLNIFDESGGTEVFTILEDGKVGIGDTTPDATLDIEWTDTTAVGLIIDSPASQTGDLLQAFDNTTLCFGIDDDGYLIADSTLSVTVKGGAAATEGSDLVTNGDFDADSDWVKGGSPAWTIGGGVATKTAGTGGNLTQDLTEASGNMYRVRFDYTRTAGELTVAIGGVTHSDIFNSASGSEDIYVVSAGPGDLSFIADDTFAGTVDKVVVTLITKSVANTSLRDSAGTLKSETRIAGTANSFDGLYSGQWNTTGSYNSAQGYASLYANTTGSSNSAQGRYSLRSNTTGSFNSAQGAYSLYSNTEGSSNAAQGVDSLRFNTTGNSNSAQGAYSLRANTTGSYNSAQGMYCLYSNTTGSSNSAQGRYSLRFNTTGNYNSAQGAYSLYSNTTGNYNSAQGYASLYYSQTGSNNTSIGYRSGGYGTGAAFTGADNNTIIGYQAGYNLAQDDDGNVYLGYQAGYNETGSNTLYIENSSSATPLIYGDFSTDDITINGNLATAPETPTLDAATTIAVNSNVITLTCTGAETLTTITGGVAGQLLTIIFADANCTVTDTDAHTANTIDLAGTATNLTSADDMVLQLVFDGTSFYEVSRSTN